MLVHEEGRALNGSCFERGGKWRNKKPRTQLFQPRNENEYHRSSLFHLVEKKNFSLVVHSVMSNKHKKSHKVDHSDDSSSESFSSSDKGEEQDEKLREIKQTFKKKGPADFDRIALLGRGDVGRVYLVKMKGTDTLFAMKVLRKADMIQRNKVNRGGSIGSISDDT